MQALQIAAWILLVLAAAGAVYAWIGMRRERAARLRAESAAAALAARDARSSVELAALREGLTSLSSSVSHDLRGPLTAISGFGQLLAKKHGELLGAEGTRHLNLITEAAHDMSALIDALLGLFTVLRAPLNAEDIQLDSLAAEIGAKLRDGEPERQVELAIEPNLTVRGDPDMLRTLLDNLLRNAWKFSGKRERAEIAVGRRVHEGNQVYFVRDNGAGFDMRYATKLFRPFERLHLPSEFPGRGIGLALVQRIVQRHGGRVWAEAEADRGATFYFTLN